MPQAHHAANNEWQLANGRWNWPKIEQAYLAGRWPDYPGLSAEVGVAQGQVRKVAMDRQWNSQRTALQQQAEQIAKERILGRMAREFEKRLAGMLDTADVLRFKGVETLGNEKTVLTASEAIKALATATDIEREIFLRRGKAIGSTAGDEDGTPPGPAPGQPQLPDGPNPGLLQAPTTISELTDAHLVTIIGCDGRELGPVERRLAPVQDGDHAPGSGGRRAKAKGSA